MKRIKDWLSRSRRNSPIASETDVGKELEQDDMQPEKRHRIVDEQSMVVYGQQGSSSNSQLTSQLVTLYNNSAEYQRIVILTEKLNGLFARRHDVLNIVETAEIQPGKKRRKVVQNWLEDVQRLNDNIQTKILDGQGSSNSNLSDFIESSIKNISELLQRGNFPNGLVLSDHKSMRYPLLLDKKLVGINFQQNTKEIIKWLQDDVHYIIGVYGMGGVGKTTLLKHIHDQLLQDYNLFGDVCWVTVSQNCSVHKLQENIAKAALGFDLQEHDEIKRAGQLYRSLAAKGQTVLILDDMWEHVSVLEVGIPLGKDNCKIILSSRSLRVCNQLGCEAVKAELLSVKEALDLFVEKLGNYEKLEPAAKEKAQEVVKECGGLPLAIATMARSMTQVFDIDDWIIAANDLKCVHDQADMKKGVYRILRYSYDRLNDKRVQECFLSCILYGEDEKITRTKLIDLWINEGLLDEMDSRATQKAKGHVILNKLESSCLLESTLDIFKDKCVKMHDLIRDMGIIITKEHPVFMAEARKKLEQVPKEEKWSKNLAKVSLYGNSIEEISSGMAPMTPHLTLLMLNFNPIKKIPDSFFVHMRALTVLDLSETRIERVPESVSDLENLRVLLLYRCEKLRYVPSVAKLTKLRNLDLWGCWELEKAPRGLERLKSVEKVSYIPWDVSDMMGFNTLIQSLNMISLSCYRFSIQNLSFFESCGGWDLTSSSDELEVPYDKTYDVQNVSGICNEFFVAFYKYQKAVLITGTVFEKDKNSCLLPTTLEFLGIVKCDMKGRSLGDVFPSLREARSWNMIVFINCRGLEGIPGTQPGSNHVLLKTRM